MGRYLKGSRKQQCAHEWERRGAGMRYVYARGRCTRETWHPSGYCSDIDALSPRKVVRGKLDLLIASPSCVHHSTARGGMPMNEQDRASGWCVVRWAEALQPRYVLVENVPAFESWCPLGVNGRPMKSRKGETFRAWLKSLKALGYSVEHRILNAADYGDATTRKRLFILAWRGRERAPWPLVTHTALGHRNLFGTTEQWRPAKEIIDWGLEGQSIFNRKKPLAEKTLARIAEGLRRFGGKDLVPFVLGQQSGSVPREVTKPLPTVAGKGAVSLVEPFIVPRYGERPGQRPRVHSIHEPMPTIPGTNQHGLVEPFVVAYYGTGTANAVSKPLPTVTSRDRFGLVKPEGLDIRFRMLAPHELSAAMGFPEDYEFAGTKTEVVKQIGNAVPVGTARSLCESMLQKAAAVA